MPHIRTETTADHPAIFHVNHLAFGRADEARLVDALRTDRDAFIPALSLVGEEDGAIVGHILFTRIHITKDGGRAVESLALAPMAVLPQAQRKGIGGALVRAGLEAARSMGHGAVIVLGHVEYYPAFGFVPASRWGIRAPFEVPDAAFMALELRPGALADAAGVVVYPPAFATV